MLPLLPLPVPRLWHATLIPEYVERWDIGHAACLWTVQEVCGVIMERVLRDYTWISNVQFHLTAVSVTLPGYVSQ